MPAFELLHPGSLASPPRRFRMQMEPSSRGLQSIGDSLPHPISVLQALLPGALDGTWQWIDNELTVITVPGAGHFIQQDAPDTVTRAMVDWLAAHPPKQ